MIDIIIPTMWYSNNLLESLQTYIDHNSIGKIILIDNNKRKRPNSDLLQHNKVELICYGKNIFVNPAWNEGVSRAQTDIIGILNDDIKVDPSVFDMVLNFNLKEGDVIGVNLQGRQNNYVIDEVIDTEEEIVKLNYDSTKPIGGQAWAFGICMFMHKKTYKPIPKLYKVWYGDDYLAQRASDVYVINSNKIKGTISETLKKFTDPNSEVSLRVEMDSKNLLRFKHFRNNKNWEIPKNIQLKYQRDRENLYFEKFFEIEYEKAKDIPSDINENVHILYNLAQECEHVTEMGVRTGVSTRALLNTNVELISYDIILNKEVNDLFEFAKQRGKKVKYLKANVLDVEIQETDMLFIDTLHTYRQLKTELKLHGNKAKKYLAFHDTNTFGLKGEIGNDKKGLLSAIIEFIIENPHWRFKIYKDNNNGFTVLERTN